MTSKFLLTLLTLAIMALGVSACLQMPTPNAPTPTPTALLTPTPNATRTPVFTLVPTPNALGVIGNVYIRQTPNGIRIGSLALGAKVYGICAGDWCKIEKPAGYVWRGCLSDNPDNLLCREAK